MQGGVVFGLGRLRRDAEHPAWRGAGLLVAQRRGRKAQGLGAAAHAEGQGDAGGGVLLDRRRNVAPIADGFAVDRGDAVARLQAGARRRTVRLDGTDHRRQRPLFRDQADLPISLLFAEVGRQPGQLQGASALAACGVVDRHAQVAAIHRAFEQRHAGVGPRRDVLVADAQDAVALLETGTGRDVVGVADDRQVIRLADHEHHPERDDGEDQVERWSRRRDRHALPTGLRLKVWSSSAGATSASRASSILT